MVLVCQEGVWLPWCCSGVINVVLRVCWFRWVLLDLGNKKLYSPLPLCVCNPSPWFQFVAWWYGGSNSVSLLYETSLCIISGN